MEIFEIIRKQALEFMNGLITGYDHLTGEVIHGKLTLTEEHNFYFKFLSVYTEAKGKIPNNAKTEIIQEYKHVLFEINKLPYPSDKQVEAIKNLRKSKMDITDISEVVGLPIALIEIVLYDNGVISATKFKYWSDEEIEQLKSHDWNNPSESFFEEIAKIHKRTTGSIRSAAKKHGLYVPTTLSQEEKMQANIEKGLPRLAGCKWNEDDEASIQKFDWSNITPSKIHSIASEFERTYGSIVAKACHLELISNDKRIELLDNK